MNPFDRTIAKQHERNAALLADTPLAAGRVESQVLPFSLNISSGRLSPEDDTGLSALEKTAAAIAINADLVQEDVERAADEHVSPAGRVAV